MYYYKEVKDQKIISVEAKSGDAVSPNFVKTTKAEYDSFIASLPPPVEPEPTPDDIRAKELLSNPPTAITQPEMWELIRIFGRRLGY